MTIEPFVGRERQLAQLDAFLDQALAGRGQIAFVTGDAGAGKTTLAAEFMRRAQTRQQDLVAAVAMGDPQTGASDPYLIFREVLALLTGDVESRLAQGAITPEGAKRLQGAVRTSIDCLVEFGPDLIGLLVPGANLAVQVAKIGIETGKRAGLMDKLTQAPSPVRPNLPGQKGIDQGQIFEQYAKVLRALSQHAPLLLILDDLQWADISSIDLLFHLARRIESSRIFIVAMYRPAEIALGRAGERHPLEKVVTEIKRYYGDVIIDLDAAAYAEGAAFIAALLDAEPNLLGPGFRRALLERTGGNALFVVELLRDMEEQGAIARDEQGRWVEVPGLDWSALPARAEGVIEARISRLTGDLLEALKLASVQGDAFTAEVVAQIRELNTRDFVRQLSSELEKRHRLVSAQGQQRVGEQRLSQYQFQNRLFQQYLYAGLDPTERAYLHEDIGRALEGLYGERADEAAARLAWHFEEASVSDKARHYLRRAGEQAVEHFAHAEAVDLFTRALALTPADDLPGRFALILGRVKACNRLGRREVQTADVQELERLAALLADADKSAEAAYQLATCEETKHNYAAAAEASQRAIAWAQAAGHAEKEIEARLIWSAALNGQGEYPAALVQAEQAVAQAQAAGLTSLWAEGLRRMGQIERNLSQHAAARNHLEQALQIYRDLGDRRGEGKTTMAISWLLLDEGQYVEARTLDEFVLGIERETGDRRGEAITLNNLADLLVWMGDLEVARTHFNQVLAMSREMAERMVEGAAHVNLSTISRMQGDYSQALAEAEAAHTIFEAIQSPYGKSHSWLRRGHALAGLGRWEDAMVAYENAIAIHQQLGNATLGLEPQAGIARVRLAQGDASQALVAIQPLLDHLNAGHEFDGVEEPLWMHWTCYETLQANGDPRADGLLSGAYRRLMESADKFSDENARCMFLANIPHHREIVKAMTGEVPAPPAIPPAGAALAATPLEAVQPADTAPVVEVVEGASSPLIAPVGAGVGVETPPPDPAVKLSSTTSPAAPRETAAPAQPGRSRQLPASLRRLAGHTPAGRSAVALDVLVALAVMIVLLTQIPARFTANGCPPTYAGEALAGKVWRGRPLVAADLAAANLYGANLAAADLTAASLISATLATANLSQAVLVGANAGRASLAGADLTGANLRGADLRTADLRGARLAGADLTSASLQGAILIGADLTGVDLTDADLSGANLAAARLDGATWTAVHHDTATRWPHGFAPPRND